MAARKKKNEQRTPFETPTPLQIRYAAKRQEAISLRNRGFTPVECAFGRSSVMDELCLDHHGKQSNREGVAVRAYRDHWGARRSDVFERLGTGDPDHPGVQPWFVVTGFCDEDATFAIASLAGVIPHPTLADMFPDAPPAMLQIARQNLEHIAELINKVDINPDLAIDLVDSWHGRLILTWRQIMHPTIHDRMAWITGVGLWRALLTGSSLSLTKVAPEIQEERFAEVRSARSVDASPEICVVDMSAFGRNSAYYKLWLEQYSILVVFFGGPDGRGQCSFVARDMATVQAAFGKGGFLKVYPKLSPTGCGGREIIGGTSRSGSVDWEGAIAYAQQLEDLRKK